VIDDSGMDELFVHQTVLLHEAVTALDVIEDGCYVDGTFGRGGHSREILKKLGSAGCLIAIDKDARAVEQGKALAEKDPRFSIKHGSFVQAIQLIEKEDGVDGLLLDLGVSSPQLDDASRGFSFMKAGPLDMRMDDTSGKTAADWVNEAEEGEIARVLKDYGEERFSRRIARGIIEARSKCKIENTLQLAEIISVAIPRHEKHKHPATRSFQAIRIHINRELEELEKMLELSIGKLKQGGRLVVISFHSLEDRLVKRFMRDQSRGERLPAGLPVQYEQTNASLKLVGKAVFPSEEEVIQNPRSRSAVMRVAEKL
jgi:16S rRNA (cytosine1402-N4)-methyltransferase